jgi:hypothetical protein
MANFGKKRGEMVCVDNDVTSRNLDAMKVEYCTIDQQSIGPKRLIKALSSDQFKAKKEEEKWHRLIRMLPQGLRSVLYAEVTAGNYVTSVQYSDWPQNGNILVSLGLSFKSNLNLDELGVVVRDFNDPRYWDRDFCWSVNGVDYLIIC